MYFFSSECFFDQCSIIFVYEYKENNFVSLGVKYCLHFNGRLALTAMYSFKETKLPKKTAFFTVSFQLELLAGPQITGVPSNDSPWQDEAFKAQFLHDLELFTYPRKKNRK